MNNNNVNNMNNQQQTVQANQAQTGINTNPYINNMNVPASNASMQGNPYINQNANTVNPVQNANAQNDSFLNGDFVKGALIGAGVAFLLTNKTTQKAIFNGFSKGSELVQAGIEELKERMEDAKAQMEAKEF